MSLYSLVINFTTKKMGLFIGAASIFAFKVEIVLGREQTQIYGKTIIATFSLFAALFCAASSRDFEGHWEGILAEMKAFQCHSENKKSSECVVIQILQWVT